MKKLIKDYFPLTTVLVAAVLFGSLYVANLEKVNAPARIESDPADFDLVTTGTIHDNQAIYDYDSTIYDVYLRVFPTKDESGTTLVFDDFQKHEALDHDYNPVLNCNIQILDEDQSLDPMIVTSMTNATIRVRGNSARGEAIKSYKIKMDDDTNGFKGQYSLNINKHMDDITRVTQKFCTDLLALTNTLISYRTNFMRVYILDDAKNSNEYEYYGLFTNSEQANKTYLGIHNLGSSSNLYKAEDFSFNQDDRLKSTANPLYKKKDFEEVLSIMEGDSNHEPLLAMIDAINDNSLGMDDLFGQYLNQDNYLDFLAFNILVGGDDILNHNFLIYNPNNSTTFYLIPYDFDKNMQVEDASYIPYSLMGGQKYNMSPLHHKFLTSENGFAQLKQRVLELKDKFLTSDIQVLLDSYQEVLSKTIYLSPDLSSLKQTPSQTLAYLQSYPELIEDNYTRFLNAFDYPAPIFTATPVFNQDRTLHLAWDNSYSYQGLDLHYQVRIYNDYAKSTIIYQNDSVIDTATDTDVTFGPGTYYLEVNSVDSAGHVQPSLEHFEFKSTEFVYVSGLMEFTLQ